MIKWIFVALLATAIATAPAAAAIRNVPADYPTLQAALNASTAGDVIRVAPGTYVESLVIGAAQDGVTLESTGGAAVTTIDGNNLQRVITCSSVGPQTVIRGFTIANGRAQPGTPNNLGGGLKLFEADLRIEDNIIRNNFAEGAGGLYIDYSTPTLIRNTIRDNQALGSGGGIYCDHFSNARIESNIIARNSAGQYGGGITAWEISSPRIVGNTIVANTAVLGGGGLYITRECASEITRNIIAFNNQGGGIVRNDPVVAPTLTCNDVHGNLPGNFTGLTDVTGTNGNQSADPLFCNFPALDLSLGENSPCASDHSPAGCGLVGAVDVGCGVVAVENTTWGQIKARLQ
jgi:predicted outer membrane repeat protein